MLLYSGRVVPIVMSILVIGCSGSTGPSKPPATPAAVISIDTVTTLDGQSVAINLRLTRPDGDGPLLDSLSGFDFFICYDTSSLRFVTTDKGPGISHWEYFTYRTMSMDACPSCGFRRVRIVALRDIDDGVSPDPPQYFPSGILATLRFFVPGKYSLRGTSAPVGFCLQGCRDNTMTRVGSGEMLYAPDTTLGQILHMDGYDTIACPHVTRSAVLELRGGSVLIEDPTRPRLGDVDLNGIPFQVNDAVVFSNYFHRGYAAFDPERASEQIAAADCDGDGEPLTRADLRVMIRDIIGDPFWDSLAVPYQDTLVIRPRPEGDHWVLSCESTIQVDELWFQISVPTSQETVHYLGQPPAVVSSSTLNGRLQVACGTVNGQHIFGPEAGDRFEVQGYSGYWFFMTAQASRYPGVSMKVRVLLSY